MMRLSLPKSINRMSLLRLLTVAVCVGLLLLASSQLTRLVSSQTPSSGEKPKVKRLPPVPKCPDPTLQTIYAPTIGIAEVARGRIVFNSRNEAVTEVRPTFYTDEGAPVSGRIVSLQPAEIRTVDINTLIPAEQRWRPRWGGMSLSYTGKAYDIWAQIMLVGDGRSGSTDVTFSVLNGLGSDTQEAVWWMPQGGRAVIALGNSSNIPIQTKLQFSNGDSQVIDIKPFATEYVRLRPRASGNDSAHASLGGRGESVRLETVGPAGSLKAVGLVARADGRLQSSIRFYDIKSFVQQNLFATNMKLRGYTPRITLRNTSAAAINVQPRFRPASGENGEPVELPSVTLAPKEITELNLTPLMAAAAYRSDLKTVSVQIINSGPAGSLIGAINGVEMSSGATYDVPLRDSGLNRNNSGAYPWRIDGDFTSVVSVTNVGDSPSNFVAEIRYPGGKYLISPRELAVGETDFFDIKKIRDQQVPDANGDLLPRSVTSGQFRWRRSPSPGTPHMIGRSAVSSISQGISASYSCIANCGAYGPVYIIDGNPEVVVGSYQAMHTREGYCGASGGCSYYNTNLYDSTVDNTSIASLAYMSSGWMKVNGLAPGETNWWWSYWYGYEYDDGFDCRYAQDEYTGSEPTTVVPRIDSISPSRILIGTPVDVVISGSGLGNVTTVNAGSGISVSINSTSDAEIHARFNVAANATAGNHGVFATTSTGLSSNGGNFFVQVPASLTVLLAGPALPLPNGCPQSPPPEIGTQLRISYQINDQTGMPITAAMTGVREDKINLTILGQQNPNFNQYDVPLIAGATQNDGTFVDVPIGVCGDPAQLPPAVRNSFGTFTQNIYVLVGTSRYSVRTNNFTFRFRDDCAEETNGADINVNNCPAP